MTFSSGAVQREPVVDCDGGISYGQLAVGVAGRR
jgi:hypothetical protein